MAIRDYNYAFFPNCDRVLLYHPAYDQQGFILFDCYEKDRVPQRAFDYAEVFCYQGKCREGTPFEYDLKTKAIHVDKELFHFR